jgi:hypothetical protein
MANSHYANADVLERRIYPGQEVWAKRVLVCNLVSEPRIGSSSHPSLAQESDSRLNIGRRRPPFLQQSAKHSFNKEAGARQK